MKPSARKHIHAAYLNLCDSVSRDITPNRNWSLVRRVEKQGGLCCVYQNDLRQEIVVVFRGTVGASMGQTVSNLIDDISVGSGSHHKGFQEHARMFKPVAALVRARAADTGYAVVCTGMSLGGASACHFSQWVDCQVVTFGCPRITKRPKKFARRKRIVHYVIHSDLIGKLPPGRCWVRPGRTITLPNMPGIDHTRSQYQQALERLAS